MSQTEFVKATIEVCIIKPKDFNNCGDCNFLVGKKRNQSCVLFVDTCPNGLRSSKCKQTFQPQELEEQICRIKNEYS